MTFTSILNVIAVTMGSLALRFAFSSGPTLKIEPGALIVRTGTTHHEFWESSPEIETARNQRTEGADHRHIGDVVAKL
ncbi:hypothetical protein [Bradyrhizobium sp. JYMT SZCCT0428]|uniref:hypothetical protein n=1 Tax=Bradyrhizobium sp. JYMT SZCCT0428 TaxID=2807673 RepID=UPI001BAC5D0F|nr:hypothetical protein [Bradyrhizobium sp. JYMT SZCCT0428]MBR1151576.1 hypothetical protein [Bradyrhizobium sp. JYMT SZCCT0428]